MNSLPQRTESAPLPASPVAAATAAPIEIRRRVNSTGEAKGSITPEIVIGLCGPIGSPLHATATQIENALREYGYTTESIRLSDLIRINAAKVDMVVDEQSRFSEIKSLIVAGDQLRERFGSDVLAKLAIAKISADRQKRYGEFTDRAAEQEAEPSARIAGQRICHVLDSIKNEAELQLLRLIYGDAFFAVGVFSPMETRTLNLSQPGELSTGEVDLLIDQDSGEEFDHGQSVRDTFPKCDFFLRVDHAVVSPSERRAIGQILEKLRRFFDLLFRTAVVTPTPEETAMYAAASAARNSACLSRQVGAAVTSGAGELLAIGWNDVPRSGGGLYGKPAIGPAANAGTGISEEDHRCFAEKGAKCKNDEEKATIAVKIIDTLVETGVVDSERHKDAVAAILGDTRVKDLIEFSRAVHAEMHAILGANRVSGSAVLGGKLYVTTYPCHSCARHLVAAGIAEVHYIEPYRKSLATRLHEDALTESIDAAGKVRLLQFDGIAPRRFVNLFESGSRKAGGVLRLSGRMEAVPSTHVSLRAIPRLEEVVVAEITDRDLSFLRLTPEVSHDGSSAQVLQPARAARDDRGTTGANPAQP